MKTVSAKENGKLKAKVVIGQDGPELYTTRNGWQWSVQPITPDLTKLMVGALKEYLKHERSSLKRPSRL